MEIILIAAMSENRVIGKNNGIPWRIPGELKRFKEITWGYPVIMGRKTFTSIGKALPGRKNIVITRDLNFSAKDCVVVNNVERALDVARDSFSIEAARGINNSDVGGPGGSTTKIQKIFIIGGDQIYRQTLSVADKIYLTMVYAKIDGDAFFPEIPPEKFSVRQEERHEARDGVPAFSYLVYERV